jgi:hypothetical protein
LYTECVLCILKGTCKCSCRREGTPIVNIMLTCIHLWLFQNSWLNGSTQLMYWWCVKTEVNNFNEASSQFWSLVLVICARGTFYKVRKLRWTAASFFCCDVDGESSVHTAYCGYWLGSSSSSSSVCLSVYGADGIPPNSLQPSEADCANPAFGSPVHLHVRRRERPLSAKGGTMGKKCPIKFSLTNAISTSL